MCASICLQAIERFAPQADSGVFRLETFAFLASPSAFIGYAVMGQAGHAAVVPLSTGWSDLSSWKVFYRVEQGGDSGNACDGDIMTQDAENCYFNTQHRLLARHRRAWARCCGNA